MYSHFDTVLITGGSRGIGAEMVKAFSAQGYRVAFIYLNSDEQAKELSKSMTPMQSRQMFPT